MCYSMMSFDFALSYSHLRKLEWQWQNQWNKKRNMDF